jgi:DinB family protein
VKFKSAPDRWSVAEILEHIVVVEQSLLENTYQKVMQAPAGKPDRDYNSVHKLVLSAIADRTQRAQAPEPVVSKGRWQPPETLDRFLKIRAQTAEFLKSTPGLRDHVADSPIGQPLDAYQWLLFISAHSDRHTKQILEVKADTNFPKN